VAAIQLPSGQRRAEWRRQGGGLFPCGQSGRRSAGMQRSPFRAPKARARGRVFLRTFYPGVRSPNRSPRLPIMRLLRGLQNAVFARSPRCGTTSVGSSKIQLSSEAAQPAPANRL
jgi:hypothetical protein